MSWAVMGESERDGEVKIQGGYRTRGAAESHPVRLALWKRVWVEQERRRPKRQPAEPLRREER